jgi:glycosyltransferase involved in cell wall biosynthesis
VIGTLTGANAEVVIDGQTGFSMPVGDSAALASALRTLIVNPSLRHELGARGRRLVEQRYDSSVNVPRIIEAMTAQVDAHRRVAGARREQGPSSDPLH